MSWRDVVREIWLPKLDQMIHSGRYAFAYDYLTSVRDDVERTGYISDRQKLAVHHIEASVGKKRRRA